MAVALSCITAAQTPRQLATYAKIVGGSGQVDEAGWIRTTTSLSHDPLIIYEKGGITVEFYTDGVFRSADSVDRWALATKAAKRDAPVLIKKEEQAYQLAEAVLKKHGLWRPTAVRSSCHLFPAKSKERSNGIYGIADVYFDDTYNGIHVSCNTLQVDLDRFTGEVVRILVERRLNFAPAPITLKESDAKKLALAFARATDELYPVERDAFMDAVKLTSNRGRLVYERDPVVGRWDASPVYQFYGRGIGIQVNALTEQSSVYFMSFIETVNAGIISPNTEQPKHKLNVLAYGLGVLIAVAVAIMVLKKRAQRSNN